MLTIARGLRFANGVAVKDGALYVAEVSRISRYDNIESSLAAPPKAAVVYDKYPKDHHPAGNTIPLRADAGSTCRGRSLQRLASAKIRTRASRRMRPTAGDGDLRARGAQ